MSLTIVPRGLVKGQAENAFFLGPAVGSAVDIPAFGGRLEVNWAPGAKVTSAGGLAHFAMFLKASGLFDRLCGDFPVHHRSNNSCSNRDILGTAVLAILLWKTRYVHIEALGVDVLPGKQHSGRCEMNRMRAQFARYLANPRRGRTGRPQ